MKLEIYQPQLIGSKVAHTYIDHVYCPNWFYKKCSQDPSCFTFAECNTNDLNKILKNYKFDQIQEETQLFNDSGKYRPSMDEGWWCEKYTCAISYHKYEDRCTNLKLLYSLPTRPNQLIEDILNIIPEPKITEENHIHIITEEGSSLKLKKLKIKENSQVNLPLNYGPGFPKIDEKIRAILNEEENGLMILNGPPGTGKTSYIRYLLSSLKKKVIYIPPNMVESLSQPGFVTFLLDHSDSILLIEDAEDAVVSRAENVRTQSVSNLLNISDGILGDCLRLKILCTFNIEIDKIDPALLRKGRLKLKYQFEPLPPDEANKLLKSLKIDYITKESMTLADIYNKCEDNLYKPKIEKTMGFSSLVGI